MKLLLSPEQKSKLDEFMVCKTSTQDGKNILLPFITLFQDFLATLETKFEDFKKDMFVAGKAKDEQIAKLQAEVAVNKKTISKLEEGLDEQCQYSRRESLLFSGDSVPPSTPGENCIDVICKLVPKLGAGITIAPHEISIAHRLGPKPASSIDRRSIIVRFTRRTTKYNLLSLARKQKPKDLYVNENLTAPRQTITRVLRKAKRDYPNKISGYTTVDGSINVWVKPPNPDAPNSKVTINTLARLENFCLKEFGLPATSFIAPRGPGSSSQHGRQ